MAGKSALKKSLVNVLSVVYAHNKTSDGGDLYLTQFAEPYQEQLRIKNWYEKSWFDKHRIRLKGTSSVYKVPTKKVDGKSLDLVVKNCRVGEDVPLNTHTLTEFCNAEFNSPWEEFSLVTELRDSGYGPKEIKVKTQLPMAIYVPPEKMQLWQSGRSRTKINRIRAKHPGIDLDILKQYKLVYKWIKGKNLMEVFEQIGVESDELIIHLKKINGEVISILAKKGYLMADMKPEHIIINENDVRSIEEIGAGGNLDAQKRQVELIYQLINVGRYSMIDYELLLRTQEHEKEVKYTRRHSYLDDQKNRFKATPLPAHLKAVEIFGVPYIYGHAESTAGHLWVVGKNARLFDYFLPERWRKTPSLKLSRTREVFYTLTKDNIYLIWKTSRVGEMPDENDDPRYHAMIKKFGINSPFEESAIAYRLSQAGIPTVYVRAVYMTGSPKIEPSVDLSKYISHSNILDPEGNPILQKNHNYITIRGYYNGPDPWVAEQEGPLYVPIDLEKAVRQALINEHMCQMYLDKTKQNLMDAGYDGTLLKANDLLMAVGNDGEIVKNRSGEPEIIICNFEFIWKT